MNYRYFSLVLFTLFWLVFSANSAISQPIFTEFKIAIAHQESRDKKVEHIASNNAAQSEDEEQGDPEQVNDGLI